MSNFPSRVKPARAWPPILITLLLLALPGGVRAQVELPPTDLGEPVQAGEPTLTPDGSLDTPSLDRSLETEPLFTGCTRVNVPVQNEEFERRVLELVNIERAKVGLHPLIRNADLDYAARFHARDMHDDNYFNHDSYDRSGSTLVFACGTFTRITNYYSGWSWAGENIAGGYYTPEEVMYGGEGFIGWMQSAGHRANILDPTYREIGIGYFYGPNGYNYYWVQDFGLRQIPTLDVTKRAITIFYDRTNSQSFPQTVTLKPINAVTSHVITWQASETVDWLSLSNSTGSTPNGSFTITANGGSLSTGTYNTVLTITANSPAGALNTQPSIPVQLVVTDEIHQVHLPLVTR